MKIEDVRRVSAPIGILLWMLGSIACAPKEPPVGSLSVSPGVVDLAYPGYASVELSFDMTAPIEGERPYVFVHLVDEPGSVVRTFDHELPVDWKPGSETSYTIVLLQSALAEPLEPGAYQLTAGLYRGDQRWPLGVDGEEVDRQEYVIASVEVLENGSKAPMFHFSPTWLPTESGTDAQVLGRRWLTAKGVLRLATVQAPGTLRMAVSLPRARPDLEDFVLEEGRETAGADIRSTCGGDQVVISGPGQHIVEIPVSVDEEGNLPEQCEIEIEPWGRLVDRATLQTRAVLLDTLAWKAR